MESYLFIPSGETRFVVSLGSKKMSILDGSQGATFSERSLEKKVMLDRDLAQLYDVETKVFKQAVRRNIERFPEDFMFELSKSELINWRSQFVTSSRDKMGLRYSPMVFTEQGVAMLSGVLRSKTAIHVKYQIMRAFTKMRQINIR